MIFDALYDSAKRGELTLIDGGMCRWHLRKDGQITIYEIISTRRGAGTEIIDILLKIQGATSIFAKCPSDLDANGWYKKVGFVYEGKESASSRTLNLWRMEV